MSRIGDRGTPPPREFTAPHIRLRQELIDAWVDRLKAAQGEWMVVDRKPGRNVSRGPYVARGCEVTQRHEEDGHTVLWARWPNGEVA
jgi:hypothetical protein